jgi:hypothetical protein
MIVGFIMNLLYVPILFTFIIDLFSEKDIEQKPKNMFIKSLNMDELEKIPCFNFNDIKGLKHMNLNHIEKYELLEWSQIIDMKISHTDVFYVDIVDDSLSMLNIYCGDKVLISNKEDLSSKDLGMFFLDDDSKKIIFGHIIEGYKSIDEGGKCQPAKWVEGYWNNYSVYTEEVLLIGKVMHIKTKY